MATGPGSYSRHKFLSELNTPLSTAAGIKAPSTQRAEVIANIFGAGGTLADPGIAGDVLFQDDVTIEGDLAVGGVIAPTAGIGTPGTDVVAVESGDSVVHTTVLTVTDLTFGVTDDSTALASGYLVYTFPAGDIRVRSAAYAIGVTTEGPASPTTDTPDMGLGTTIASGANAVLSGSAAFENILTGQTVNDVAGTVEAISLDVNLIILAAADHTVYLNIGDTWANFTPDDPDLIANGYIVLEWERLTSS